VAALGASLENKRPLPVQSLARPGWDRALAVRVVPLPPVRPAFWPIRVLRRASPMAHYATARRWRPSVPTLTSSALASCAWGIVSCTLTGAISYSRRFYEEVLQDPTTASPMIFPETVF